MDVWETRGGVQAPPPRPRPSPAPARVDESHPAARVVFDDSLPVRQSGQRARRRLWYASRPYVAAALLVAVFGTAVVATRNVWEPVLGAGVCGARHEVYTSPQRLLDAVADRLGSADACGVARLHPVTQFDPVRHLRVRRLKTQDLRAPTLAEPPFRRGMYRITDGSGRTVAQVTIGWWPGTGQPVSPEHWHVEELTLF